MIPVVILAGFLGSGKTTALNHLLAHADGRRLGVLVNDFGAVNIDALLVSGTAAGTVSLPGGCICCVTDADSLGESMRALADSGVDAIVVEASGIAEPRALIRLVVAARDERLGYGGLVYLVDAGGAEQVLADHPSVAGHIGVADLVALNKIDLIDEPAARRLRERLAGLNPTAPVLPVVRAAIDPALLLDPAGAVVDDSGPRQLSFSDLIAEECDGHDDHSGHLHAAFASVALETERPVDPRRLAALLERPPAGAYRCKGLVRVDLPGHRGHAYEVHAVGGFVQVSVRRWDAGGPRTSLVVIGAGLDETAARAALEEVCTPAPADDENGIAHLTRHLVTPS
ncbi:CobW family GTP-binding protein [Gordonia sp. VNK21]|uniref:CobW family GTP-binding protein n=1 Tax=Gordonia sp. VNK21 TaxID=3382483 RepID=UPI0038D3F9E2